MDLKPKPSLNPLPLTPKPTLKIQTSQEKSISRFLQSRKKIAMAKVYLQPINIQPPRSMTSAVHQSVISRDEKSEQDSRIFEFCCNSKGKLMFNSLKMRTTLNNFSSRTSQN